MAPISWVALAERPGPRNVGNEAESDRLWIEAHPIVHQAENTLVLRFTDTVQLAELLNAVITHYGRWVTSTVITKSGEGKQVFPHEDGAFTRFLESQILVTLGAQSLKSGVQRVGIAN